MDLKIVLHLFQHSFLQNTMNAKGFSVNLISVTVWDHFKVHLWKFKYVKICLLYINASMHL